MENQMVPTQITNSSTSEPVSSGSYLKNIIIMLLTAVLILSLLGINIFSIFGNVLQQIIDIFNPVVSKALSNLGYASGTVIDKTSDILADSSKVGIDILHDTVGSVGDLLVKASGNSGKNLDIAINQPMQIAPPQPSPDASSSAIQKTPTKNSWCLVGEYNGARGCVSVSDQDKCLSGQVFPSQQMCLNPTLSK